MKKKLSSVIVGNPFFIRLFSKPENGRDAVVKRNIIQSFAFQILSNIAGLAIVPLSLTYLSVEKYGIWINASAMVLYLQNMNFGLGFGMQNHVGQSLAIGDSEQARRFVSITYKYTLMIATAIAVVGLFASYFINWNRLFNSTISSGQLRTISLIAFVSFLFSFVVGNLQPVLMAASKSAAPRFLGLCTNLLSIIGLIVVLSFSHNNLVFAALALGLPGPLIYIVASIWYFKGSLSYLQPKWTKATKPELKKVFGLGVKFFALQLTTLLIFQADIVIVAQSLGPSEVTPYNLINRYFYFLFFIFSLGITPYWPAFTEAYARKDFTWIRLSIRRLLRICCWATLAVILAFAMAFFILPVWGRHSFSVVDYIPLLITSALYIISMFFVSIFSTFLNGTSQLNLPLAVQAVLACISIPLAIFFIRCTHLGSAGVNLSMSICQIIFLAVCVPLLYRRLRQEAALYGESTL